MPFSLQPIPPESKLTHLLQVPLLEELYPREVVSELLTRCHAWEARERKLSQLLIVYYIIALSLLRRLNVAKVFAQLCQAFSWLWPDPGLALPTGSALCQRRAQLPTAVVRQLFRRCCRPLATTQTKGAFAFGLRLMALDSTLDEVADTPSNAVHFGRLSSGPSQSPFPQVRCCYLAEVGTHALVDAVFAPAHRSEQELAPVLLRSLSNEMLLLFDRNFAGASFLHRACLTGAQVLGRLASNRYRRPERLLSDGSYLISLPAEQEDQPPLHLRVIEYRLQPLVAQELAEQPVSRTSAGSDPRQVHRLVTTLLDPQQAPALDLIVLYHQRWEIELCIDEIKTHQRLSSQPLRSQQPELVYQECYGMLLAHYAVRAWMHRAALQAELDPDRLSFTHAIQVLEAATHEWALQATQERPRLRRRLLAALSEPSCLLPQRRLRFCPRVVKRAWSSFKRKRPELQTLHYKGATFRELLLI